MRRGIAAAAMVTLLISATGCADKTPPVRTVYTTLQCVGSETTLNLGRFTDSEAWQGYFETAMAATAPENIRTSGVCFDHAAVLVIDMGQKSSGGYALRLSDRQATIEEGTLMVFVKMMLPAPGMVQTRMLTHPCLALSIPKAGYEKIALYSDADTLLAEMDVAR